jgi:hypothetical protein
MKRSCENCKYKMKPVFTKPCYTCFMHIGVKHHSGWKPFPFSQRVAEWWRKKRDK